MAKNPEHKPGDQESATRREALARPGIDPGTGRQRPIQLAYEKIKALPRMGAGKMKEAAYVLPEVLRKPTAIFAGLTHEIDEPRRGAGWLCYVGRPTKCFEYDGRSIAPPRNRVFLVFVNDEWVAYNWYWYEADAQDPGLPEGYADRFHERLI